jgi:CRISPR-associated endonuclease Csn1
VPIENVSSSNLDAIPDRALRDKLSHVIAGKSTAKDVKAALEAFSRSTGIRKVIVEERLSVIPIHNRRTGEPYRYVKGDGNYCYDIFVDPKGLWTGTVVSYYRANQQTDDLAPSEDPDLKHVMRLRKGDYIFLEVEGDKRELMRVQKFSEGTIALVRPNESNVDARTRDKSDVLKYAFKSPGALGKSKASIASVDILGFVNIRR